MKKALVVAVVGSMMALSGTASAFCGKRVAAGVFLVDYSGSMMESVSIDGQEVKKVLLVKELLRKLPTSLPREADVKVGIGTLAPHTLPLAPRLLDVETFESSLKKLPEHMEIFGRNTNIGEGFAGLDQRIRHSARESDQQLKEDFAAGAGIIVVTDGGLNNRGREAAPALKAFEEKYASTKTTILSLAGNEEEKHTVRRLAESVQAPVYDAYEMAGSEELYLEFVENTLYKVCEPEPEITFSLSADTLFSFDKSAIRPEGVKELARVSEEILRYEEAMKKTGMTLSISAHTDRIGSREYNDALSRRRLDTVLEELKKNGIGLDLFSEKVAAGERQPVTGNICNGLHGQAEIDCLQPDRRVEIRLKAGR